MTAIALHPGRPSLEIGLGAVAIVLGVMALTGWVLDIAALKSILPGKPTMKANTALALLLCGLAALMLADRSPGWRRQGALLLAGAVALIGGLSLAEELFSIDLGIDQLLFRDPYSLSGLSQPGRMAPATAFCFVAMAVGLALSAAPGWMRLQLPLVAALNATVASVSVLFLLAHATNALPGYLWGSATTLAIHTAFAFLCLGLAGVLRARRLQATEWALGRAGSIGFVLGVTLMLGAAEIGSRFAQEMSATTDRVVRTQQIIQRLQEIRTDLRTMESAQRSHLMFGDESLIDARSAQKASVHGHVESLGQAAPADAPLPASLARLRAAIEQRLAFGDRLIEVRRTQGFEAARALLLNGEDVALTAQVTAAIAPMVQYERQRLAERLQHLKAVTSTTFLLLPIGSFLSLTALLVGLFSLDHGSSERRHAVDALSRSRQELQVLFDSMTEGVRVIDADRKLVQANPAGATLHGLIEPAADLSTMMAQVEALSVQGAPVALEDWPTSRAIRGDFVRGFEMIFRHKQTDREVIVAINTAPLPVAQGEASRIMLTSHDITERRRAEAAIRESQDRLERIVENLSEGLLIHGLKGDLVQWNRAALAMYELPAGLAAGLTRDEMQRRFELSTFDGQPVAPDDWPMSRLRRGEALNGVELRVQRVGTAWERVFRYGGALVRDASGQPLTFLTVADVTARKSAEVRLQNLNAELEQRVAQRTAELQAKTRELEAFCYSVSHDLKAPLRGIDGYSRLLMDEYAHKLDPDARLFIDNVRKATAQMNTLIEDLLAYSRQERRTLTAARIGLRAFVEENLARRSAELAGAQVSVELEDLRVRADREGLAMAFRNLLDNAIKFSAHARPPVITIRSRRAGDRCVLSIQDNGTGFDMRYHDKAFEIFQRLHRAEDYPGTGVGLALVRKAMERMGGRAWGESRLGEGATFHLELELADNTVTGETIY